MKKAESLFLPIFAETKKNALRMDGRTDGWTDTPSHLMTVYHFNRRANNINIESTETIRKPSGNYFDIVGW